MKCRTVRCISWRTEQTRACLNWEQVWEQRCRDWETTWSQRCNDWETTWTQRCDRWEQEQKKACDSWSSWFSWICLIWVWVTTTVCRVWTWVSTTVCKAWAWVSTTLCKLWAWISTWVCKLWVLLTTIVCTLWGVFLDIWCVLLCWIRSRSAPAEVSEGKSECIYGWTAAFQIVEEPECVIHVTERIRLQPDAGITQQQLQTAQATWKQAVEQNWTDRFRIQRTSGDCPCAEYRVVVTLLFVTSGEHHVVRVQAGSGRADMGNFFITSTGGTVSHEVGHMFGNVDEYADTACPNRNVTNDGSIMQNSQTGTVRPRHYQRFADWISAHTCCDYAVASGGR